MAQIDDLVKQVADPNLRAALAQQVAALTSRKQFGLVFQDHQPESVRLPQQRIRTGDKVQLRDEKTSATFHVLSTKASLDVATIVELDDSGETVAEPRDMIKNDLVVVKPFGDPVYPGLRQVGEVGTVTPGKPSHVVINGENYHALQALAYTHTGKVDVIYIDPPYNTGANDWRYNDRYIDNNDAYRHSKWLSFMDKRLRIAKTLLNPTGVILVSIDDNEQAHLKLLMDDIFGASNFLNNIIWHYGKMSNEARKFANNHEYVLAYAASSESKLVPVMKKEDSEYRNRWLNFVDANNQILYGYVKDKNDKLINLRVRKVQNQGIELTDETVLFDFNVEYKADSDTIYCPTIKGNASEREANFGLGQKPVDFLLRLLSAHPNPNAVVVDFFAGSGSTSEAVARLNNELGGNRQCILVTNNELAKKEDVALRAAGHRPGDAAYEAVGVFHSVTKPRIERMIERIGGQSAAFFDLTYEDENLVSLGNKYEPIAPLLWMQSGAAGTMISKIDDAGFSVPEDGNYAVIFNTASAADAIEAIHDGIKQVYVVTDSESDFRSVTANLPGDLGTTAQRLYANYLRSFEINRG